MIKFNVKNKLHIKNNMKMVLAAYNLKYKKYFTMIPARNTSESKKKNHMDYINASISI